MPPAAKLNAGTAPVYSLTYSSDNPTAVADINKAVGDPRVDYGNATMVVATSYGAAYSVVLLDFYGTELTRSSVASKPINFTVVGWAKAPNLPVFLVQNPVQGGGAITAALVIGRVVITRCSAGDCRRQQCRQKDEDGLF